MNKKESTSIVVGGDFVPIGPGVPLFEIGASQELVGQELLNVIHEADFSIFNLEVPLSDMKNPIEKCGPNLSAEIATIEGLCAVNPGAFSLANNHILDQGSEGLESTVSTLDSRGVPYFGAGRNLEQAAKPFLFKKNGISIGFYACAEHEFTIADEDKPGANPFDPLNSLDHISKLKNESDYVVVLYHGGKEHYRYPSPLLQKTCRKIVEKGADVVVCQHSHCVGCMEEYAGATIVYGQGNFLFDDGDDEYWRTGLLLRLMFGAGDDRCVKVDYLPLLKCGHCVRLAENEEAAGILLGFQKRSAHILKPGAVQEEYSKFAGEMLNNYLNSFMPGSRTFGFRLINKLTGGVFAKRLTTKQRAMSEINYLECEAHRELFIEGLKAAFGSRASD